MNEATKLPYTVQHVKELAPKFEKFLETFKGQGYTYPELIVAMQQALYTAIYWQAHSEASK